MSAPFRAQAFGRVVLLQTAAEWAGTTDKVLQDYETGRETDTGYEKTGDGVSTWAELAYDDPTPTPGGVKVYRALLTQSGTDAPTATVLENTLGGTVVWTYTAQGRYTATLAGAFPSGQTYVITGDVPSAISLGVVVQAGRTSDNAVVLTTWGTQEVDNVDNALSATAITIRIYP